MNLSSAAKLGGGGGGGGLHRGASPPPPPPKKGSNTQGCLKSTTVEPPKRGQFGAEGFVLSSEVVLSKRSTIIYHIFLHKCSHTGYYYIKRVEGQS